MKSAYLYVRVSTDEQKRRGYSLPEQEDRLRKYCEYHSIEVKGIFREDFSAKDFNRPEWKKLFATIRNRKNEEKNILFIKWDRFSRNIEFAYEMMGLLRKYKTTAMAIDQPIDFSVPESTIMLAVYLSVPEAENSRRALNTANGIRRAKLMGRYPCKAPLGFINLTTLDGRKIIAPKQPEAGIIKWVFRQLSKNVYRVEDIRIAAEEKGLKCSRSHFFRIIHNPFYCGLITIRNGAKEREMIKGVHDPLISEALFYEVQHVTMSKRRITTKNDYIKNTLFLVGFLVCPLCNRKLTGSFSQGSTKKYPYYHCRNKCKTRVNAHKLNECYIKKLKQLLLSDKVIGLYHEILDDWNTSTHKREYLLERKQLIRKLNDQDLSLSQARRLFVADILKLDDYSEIKREYGTSLKLLKKELNDINAILKKIQKQFQLEEGPTIDIFQIYSEMNVADKKHIAMLIPPSNVDFQRIDMSLSVNIGLSKILLMKNNVNDELY